MDLLLATALRKDLLDLAAQPPDADIELPDARARCAIYDLSLALWRTRTDRAWLRATTSSVIRHGRLSAPQQQQLKAERAKFRQLRDVYRLFHTAHAKPLLLNSAAAELGRVRDALRRRHAQPARVAAIRARMLLTRPMHALTYREAKSIRFADDANFTAYCNATVDAVARLLDRAVISAQQFHGARKTVGRLTRMWSGQYVLQEQEAHSTLATIQYLATLDHLLGEYHDELNQDDSLHMNQTRNMENQDALGELTARLAQFVSWWKTRVRAPE